MAYTLQQEHQILGLIKQRRKQLQDDRAALRKADELSDRQAELIASELEDLRMLEIKIGRLDYEEDRHTFYRIHFGVISDCSAPKYYRGSLFAALMVLINLLDSKERSNYGTRRSAKNR